MDRVGVAPHNTRIFSPLLYCLSYLSLSENVGSNGPWSDPAAAPVRYDGKTDNHVRIASGGETAKPQPDFPSYADVSQWVKRIRWGHRDFTFPSSTVVGQQRRDFRVCRPSQPLPVMRAASGQRRGGRAWTLVRQTAEADEVTQVTEAGTNPVPGQ